MLKGGPRRRWLAPILLALVDTYAGLAMAVVGFVQDNTALVVAGVSLVGVGTLVVNRMAKAMSRSRFYCRGRQSCR
jgi:H+-translocating NAD(P) transhydrogenase subunit beta